MSTVLDAAFHLVHDYPGGATALAPRLQKAQGTLCHELTGTGTAKLGLLDAVKLTLLTGDRRILNAFAAECGCVVLQMPQHASGSDAMTKLGASAKEFGDFVSSVGDSLRDGAVTSTELRRVRRELAEMIASAQDVDAELGALHEAAKPAHLRKAA